MPAQTTSSSDNRAPDVVADVVVVVDAGVVVDDVPSSPESVSAAMFVSTGVVSAPQPAAISHAPKAIAVRALTPTVVR